MILLKYNIYPKLFCHFEMSAWHEIGYESSVWAHSMEFWELILLLKHIGCQNSGGRPRQGRVQLMGRNITNKRSKEETKHSHKQQYYLLTTYLLNECLFFARLFDRHLGYNDKQDRYFSCYQAENCFNNFFNKLLNCLIVLTNCFNN